MVSVGGDLTRVLQRAASLLEGAAASANAVADVQVPLLFGRRGTQERIVAGYVNAALDAREAAMLLGGAGSRFEHARAAVDQLAERIDPARVSDIVGQRQLSIIHDVPSQLSVRAESLRLAGSLKGQEPAVVRAALRREVDELATQPFAKVAREDVSRIAAMSLLPAELRPPLPSPLRANYPFEELVARKMLPGSDSIARGEFERIKLDIARRELAADPTVTREALDAELRAIVATPNHQVTIEHVRRLSVIAGMPEDLRPALADTRVPWAEHRLEDLSAWGWHPAANGDARAKFSALRLAIEQEALIADPSTTRAAVTAELQELLAIPEATLTKEQLRRTALLARLPEHLRPPMPVRLDWHYRFDDLGVLGYHPAKNKAAAKVFDQMRVHMAAVVDPEGAAARMAAQVAKGELIDFRIVAAVAEHEGLLLRYGMTQEVLHAQAVRSLAGAGGVGSRQALSHHVEQVRDTIIAATPADPGLAQIRVDALELAERNLARMAGTRTDTFARHPDYAEIGRFVAMAELLDAMKPAVRAVDDAVTW